MQELLSAQTANALKDAGFPQPQRQVGQFWYSKMFAGAAAERRVLYMCTQNITTMSYSSAFGRSTDEGLKMVEVKSHWTSNGTFDAEHAVYIPTFAELWQAIENLTDRSKYKLEFAKADVFYCGIVGIINDFSLTERSANPIEALAKLYITIASSIPF